MMDIHDMQNIFLTKILFSFPHLVQIADFYYLHMFFCRCGKIVKPILIISTSKIQNRMANRHHQHRVDKELKNDSIIVISSKIFCESNILYHRRRYTLFSIRIEHDRFEYLLRKFC